MIMIHVIVWMNLEKSQETSHERTHMTPYNKCLRYENVDRKQIGGEGLRVEGERREVTSKWAQGSPSGGRNMCGCVRIAENTLNVTKLYFVFSVVGLSPGLCTR